MKMSLIYKHKEVKKVRREGGEKAKVIESRFKKADKELFESLTQIRFDPKNAPTFKSVQYAVITTLKKEPKTSSEIQDYLHRLGINITQPRLKKVLKYLLAKGLIEETEDGKYLSLIHI